MLSLRIATNADIPDILDLLEELHASSVYSSVSPFIRENVKDFIEGVVKGDKNRGCVILLSNASDKTIGLLVCSFMYQLFNQSHKSAVELAFWITPEQRSYKGIKLLLGAYKYWGRSVGCKSIMMGKLKSKNETETYSLRRL